MTTIIFVHGTGTRQRQYDQALAEIRQGLAGHRPDVQIAPCCWGPPLGARLHADGRSIPQYAETRDLEGVSDDQYAVILWSQLYIDPLYELRVLSTSAGTTTPLDLHVALAQQLDQRARSLTPSPDLAVLLKQAGIDTVFDQALHTVVDSVPYHEALGAATDDLAPSQAAIARAIVAQGMEDAERQELHAPILFDATLRDNVVDLVLAELGGDTRGLTDWVAKQLVGLALKLGAMDQVQRRRGMLTDAAFPYPGDVLLYQARGRGVRDFIQAEIERVQGPVVLLAHSLGGIACVDLLVERSFPQVKLLVTAGSQAPFLYELGALASLGFGEPLPDHFPQWLNLYDLGDFLSYVGAGVFPGRVEDVYIDTRQPFPRAHGAYWVQPATWDAIIPRLPPPLLEV